MARAVDQDLFPPEFVETISRFRLTPGPVRAGGSHGEYVSRQAGHGVDFCDHRRYLPGDDLRIVDWNVYKRTRMLFVRLFQEYRDLPLHVLLDCSDSMFFGNDQPSLVARQAAAILCGAAMQDHNRSMVWPFADKVSRPIRSTRQSAGLVNLLAGLSSLGPSGTSDIRAAVDHLRRLPGRHGMVVLISDLFDPSGPQEIAPALRRLNHKLVILRIVRRSDVEPDLSGQVRVVDCETNQPVELLVTPEVRRRYQLEYQAFGQAWKQLSARCNAPLVTLDAERGALEQLPRLMGGRILRAC